MSLPEHSGSRITPHERRSYLQRVAALRQKITDHLIAMNVSTNGAGIVVHEIDDLDDAELFDKESILHVMVHSKLPDWKSPVPILPRISIVTKEILKENRDRTTGWLINHFGLNPQDRARLRYHAELLNAEYSFTDDILGGPIFHSTENSDSIIFSSKAMDRIHAESDDDFVFNAGYADRHRALAFAESVLGLLSEDTLTTIGRF